MHKLTIAAPTIAILAVPAISMASAYRPHYGVTSLTVTTTYNGSFYLHNYTLTRGESHRLTGIAYAGSVTPGENVSGTLDHSPIASSNAHPNRYTRSYDGPLAGCTGSASLGLKQDIAVTTPNSPVNPITVTPHHVNTNDAERGPDSCSGLHSQSNG